MVAKVQPIKEPEAQASVQTISPAIAKDWLAKNIAHNRKLVPSLVLKYAEDIRANRWQMNGSTIVMAASGKIIDGQHRLHAIIQAGVPITTLVVSGVDESAFETIDSGRRRSPSDVLSIMGYVSVVELAAVANMWLWHEKTGRVDNPGRSYTATTQEVIACVTAHDEDFMAAIRATQPHRKLFGGGSILAFYWLKLAEIDQSDRDFFFDRLNDGQSLVVGDPVYALRQSWLNMRTRNRSMSRELMGGLLVKAWNKYRNREKVSLLVFTAQEAYPEPI